LLGLLPAKMCLYLLGQKALVQVAIPEEEQLQVLQSFFHVEPGVN